MRYLVIPTMYFVLVVVNFTIAQENASILTVDKISALPKQIRTCLFEYSLLGDPSLLAVDNEKYFLHVGRKDVGFDGEQYWVNDPLLIAPRIENANFLVFPQVEIHPLNAPYKWVWGDPLTANWSDLYKWETWDEVEKRMTFVETRSLRDQICDVYVIDYPEFKKKYTVAFSRELDGFPIQTAIELNGKHSSTEDVLETHIHGSAIVATKGQTWLADGPKAESWFQVKVSSIVLNEPLDPSAFAPAPPLAAPAIEEPLPPPEVIEPIDKIAEFIVANVEGTFEEDLEMFGLEVIGPVLAHRDEIASETIWVCPNETGKPNALLSISAWHHSRHIEILSLCERQLKFSVIGRPWTPALANNQVEIPDAPKPAVDDAQRLLQMQALHIRFGCTVETPDNPSERLTLLETPIYRYPNSTSENDGAVFAFVNHSDAEAILVIEVHQGTWHYMIGRMSGNDMYFQFDGQSMPIVSAKEDSSTYSFFGRPSIFPAAAIGR